MKVTSTSLLILLFFVHAAHAQPNAPLNRKLAPALQQFNRKLAPAGQEQTFWLVVSNADTAKQYFNRQPGRVRITGEYPGGLLVVKSNWHTIDSLVLPLPFTRFIDMPRQPHEELAVGSFDNSLNSINLVHSRFPQLNGSSMVASVKENKPDTSDIDFKGRYLPTPLSSASISSHASIMSTIIAGGENTFFTSAGVAPAATFTSSNFASLLPDADNDYRQYGISIQNHSYGTGVENYYGADAAAYDASINNNAGLLHIFSAGNSGNAEGSGAYAGIATRANLTGSFKMAKNIITVGATDSFNNVAFLSSKGPAYDGRVKPELVAFGDDGSSGAAAHASGTALLLQQQYKQQHNGALPASALIKAILLNSADDINPAGPDYQSGYGSLNAYKAMQTITNQQYNSGSVAQAGMQTFALTVPANTRLLKVTLCWTDPAAAANAPKALINDLDLELVNNNTAQVWLPWVLNPAPVLDSLLLPAVRKKDTLNNVEQISMANPDAGTYTIRVKGAALPTGTQPFFIAWETDTADKFQWQFPAATDYVTGNQANLLRWSTSFNTSTGTIDYSVDKGSTWKTINNAVPLSNNYLYWNVPDTFAGALLRMTINGQAFTSDTFTISTPVLVRVGFNCADSVMLYWNRVPAVTSYTVYRLGEKYLQPYAVTADTSIIIRQPGPLYYYTVAPNINAGRQGAKAYTINFTTQGVDCYLRTFLADLEAGSSGSQARLTIEIGSYYNVKSLTVEKLTGTTYNTLQVVQPVAALYYELLDTKLTDGANTYRLKIELANGLIVYSGPATVYNFVHMQYLVFPNPVNATGSFQVFAKEQPQQTVLLLFNAMGQKVLQYNLTDLVTSVPLNGCKSGVYFIRILKNGKKDFTGSIIVQ
jgi:hypothetical protein